MSNTAAEVIHSDVFIVTGSNTTENHPIIALQMKAAVEKHGAKMIVIDPRRLELVEFADLWLPIKPGTNIPLFSAMAQVIIEEGLVNQTFIEQRTEGFQEYARTLEGYTPEYAEKVSGVDRDLIRKAARLYAKAERGSIFWGMGISQLSHGTASRVSPDQSGFPDRSHWAVGDRLEPASRPEQRARRFGHGGNAVPLSWLYARG